MLNKLFENITNKKIKNKINKVSEGANLSIPHGILLKKGMYGGNFEKRITTISKYTADRINEKKTEKRIKVSLKTSLNFSFIYFCFAHDKF